MTVRIRVAAQDLTHNGGCGYDSECLLAATSRHPVPDIDRNNGFWFMNAPGNEASMHSSQQTLRRMSGAPRWRRCLLTARAAEYPPRLYSARNFPIAAWM